jgi:hypothetical protein
MRGETDTPEAECVTNAHSNTITHNKMQIAEEQ